MRSNTTRGAFLLGALVTAATAIDSDAVAQLRDKSQLSPVVAGGAINKTWVQEIGLGRGDIMTPNTSAFIIARDPFRAVRRGRQIFQRKFQMKQGMGPTTNDGVVDPSYVGGDRSGAAGLSDSCASCHGRPRGSAGAGGDVVTRPDSRDAPHLFGLGLQEQLADEITSALRAIRASAATAAMASGGPVSRVLTAKGINYGLITARADGTFDTSRVEGVDPDLRVRPFFAEGGTMSIREFLVGAFNAEMGLESPDPDLVTAAGGGMVVTPAGMVLDGKLDRIEPPPVMSATVDGDGDTYVNEIPQSIVDFMEFYLLNYFKPGTGDQTQPDVLNGRAVFTSIGCATCHVATLTINKDRRVADLETTFDPSHGNPFNRLFAVAKPLVMGGLQGVAGAGDPAGMPTLKQPAGAPFVVRNFFADFKRHNVGPNFFERNYEGTYQERFITEPLWGVATTAPYGHDGRSQNLEEVILRHGGEAQVSRDAFAALGRTQKVWVVNFLGTLVLFPPDDTASSLQPMTTTADRFPQNGHGAIALTPLFNDPTDPE
ncbi:MAG TPA: di-heme oxidoredictase family protein [Polyangia bacterium]|nr:di-heme oxidoredictase family protein [Polyangia bacterium]